MEGLGDLSLKELGLAQNPINQLDEVLNMKSREFLNVTYINIGSFKVVLTLFAKCISLPLSSQFSYQSRKRNIFGK